MFSLGYPFLQGNWDLSFLIPRKLWELLTLLEINDSEIGRIGQGDLSQN